MVEAGYLGSFSRHLYGFRDANQPVPGTTALSSRTPFAQLDSLNLPAFGVIQLVNSAKHAQTNLLCAIFLSLCSHGPGNGPCKLRIVEDADGKTNLSLAETGGEALVVSQFTLYADTSRGRRPGFTGAAPPDQAERIYRHFASSLAALGIGVKTGSFGALMDVELVNHGPFTLVVE